MSTVTSFLLVFFMSILSVNAQNRVTVTGMVSDTYGPVIGASVVEKGATTNGTITNADGQYSLSVPTNATLVISFVGYTSQEVPVNGRRSINVVLREDTELLDEVVVVGFGTQKKVNLTGAVGVATSKDLEARPVQNAVLALQGVIPGLNISNSGNGGELNASKSIDVRGIGTISDQTKATPLILIDGMEGDLATINPQDIDNISVLKDAAASSIYGIRAAFGVVLVTTKQGKAGRANINYTGNFRFNTPVMMPEMANSWEWVNYFDDAQFNANNTHLFDQGYMDKVYDYYMGKLDPTDVVWSRDGTGFNASKWNYDYTNANVNWLDEYYTKWASSQEHNVSISGGTDRLTYYVSGNYMTQDGFIRHGQDDYNRYNVSTRINAQMTDYLRLEYSGRFVRTDYSRPVIWNDGFYDNVLRRARPVRAIYDPNGYYMTDINYISTLENGGRHKEQKDSQSHQIKLTLTPLKNWNISAQLNMRLDNNWTHYDQIPVYAHYADNPEATYVATATGVTNSNISEYGFHSTYLNPTFLTDYKFSIANHNVAAMAGFQMESRKDRDLTGTRQDLINPAQPVLTLSTSATSYSMSGNYQRWMTAGVFGRINYDYQEKYLLEVNMRYDGSSRYRTDKRWLLSPSFSAGWNIARESFFEPLTSYVNTLKPRVSYGILGNQNTNRWYFTYETMTTNTNNSTWLIGGKKNNTAQQGNMVSSLLSWEKSQTFNVGFDFGALKNRLTGSFEYFSRATKDMVGPAKDLPDVLGVKPPEYNNMDLTTYGWELTLSWRDRIGDFSYGARLNISDSQTRVDTYTDNLTMNIGKYIQGQKTGNIFGYTSIGIAKSEEEMAAHQAKVDQSAEGNRWGAGDVMYADLNGDGKLDWGNDSWNDMGDKRLLGNNTPRFRTGITLDAAWKGIDVQMFWQGVLKRDYMPAEGSMVFWGVTASGQWWSTSFKDHMDYFRADADHPLGQNLDAYYPRPNMGSNKNHKPSTMYMQDASYMRLKNLQIGYTFPKQWMQKAFIQNLRVYVSGENLLTFTKLSKTMDPETAGIGRQGGTVYPLSKTFSLGLSVNF